MADGDRFHCGVSSPYVKAYKALCEGKFDLNEIIRIAEKSFLQDIKQYGHLAIKLAKIMGENLAKVINSLGENSFVDWGAESKKLQQLAQQAGLPYYTKELVLRAAKGELHNIRYKQTEDMNNLQESVVKRYFHEVFKSKFKERIPLISNHHANADQKTVTERLNAISSSFDAQFSKWAQKATADGDVKKLRRSRREKLKEIDLEENLL